MPGMSMVLDPSQLDAIVDDWEDNIEGAVRPAAQAAAQVFYDEVKRNVAALGRVTGNLDSAIYQKFSEGNSSELVKTYHISWNHKRAPHGWLVENGYLQRYRYYKGADGKVRPMVRPGMDGRPRPNRKAPRSVKEAYYVTLPVPIQVPGKHFVGRAFDKIDLAYEAANKVLIQRLGGNES